MIAKPASIDQLLRTAIAGRQLISFLLDGLRRIAEPHDYGIIDGVARLFFYQVGGGSRSGRPIGWRWGILSRISEVQVLDEPFTGPRPAPSGQHIRWDTLLATVSPRPVSRSPVPVSSAAGENGGVKKSRGHLSRAERHK